MKINPRPPIALLLERFLLAWAGGGHAAPDADRRSPSRMELYLPRLPIWLATLLVLVGACVTSQGTCDGCGGGTPGPCPPDGTVYTGGPALWDDGYYWKDVETYLGAQQGKNEWYKST